MRKWWIMVLGLAPALAFGAFGVLANGGLDMPAIRNAYSESEFEKVKNALEAYLKQKGEQASREERIFAFKHLGVIYAVDSATTPRAESYFNRLLLLSPNIELVDMYVSAKIQQLFQRIKEDRRAQADYKSQYDAFGNPLPDSKKDPEPVVTPKKEVKPRPEKRVSQSEKKRAWMWWAAGIFTVGAGVGMYVWSLQDEEGGGTVRDINVGLGGGT
jgi:hypothetical protein